MSFFAKKEELSLLVNIGNGTVTTALVVFSENIPRFLHCSKNDFVITDKPDISNQLDAMGTVLNENLSHIMRHGFKHDFLKGKNKKIDHVMVAFSSPWFLPKTKYINIVKEKEFIISNDFLADIIEKEEKIFKEEIVRDSKTSTEKSFEVVEKNIVQMKINGYTVEKSIGNKTKTLDAVLCMSIIGKTVYDKVCKIILKNTSVPKERVYVHTFPVVSFSVIKDMFIHNSNFLLMDVSDESTDLTFVTNDVITNTTSFPFGRNFIVRKLAKTFDVPLEIALSNLHLYTDKKVDESISKGVEETLIEVEKDWSKYLEESLLYLSPDMVLPHKVYVTADSDIAPLILDFMKLQKTDTTSVFRKNADVVHVNKEVLAPFFKNDSLNKVNKFISISAIFYDKMLNND